MRLSTSLCVKLVAVVTLCCFTLETVVWASGTPGSLSSVAPISRQNLNSFVPIEIPSVLGQVRSIQGVDSAYNPSAPLIINLQDAHANTMAQRNNAEIIEYLVQQQDIQYVFVEGAVGELDSKYLQFTQDPKLNQKIAEVLEEKGLFTASDIFLNKHHKKLSKKVKFLGIENPESYRKNIQYLKTILIQEIKTQEWINSERYQIDKNITQKANKDLLKFLRLLLKNKPQTFINEISLLDKLSQKHLKRNLRDVHEQALFPNLARLLRLKDNEAKINIEAAQKEWKKLRKFSTTKEKAHLESELDKILFLNQRNKEEELRFLLEKWVEDQNLQLEKHSHFSELAKNKIYQEELDSTELFSEVNVWKKALSKELVRSETDKEILDQVKKFILSEKLLTLKLTREEWNILKGLKGEILNADFIQEIKKSAFEFYKLAEARENAFLKTIHTQIKLKKIQKAIVITGGFHTSFIEKQPWKSVVISPNSTIEGESGYVKAILDFYTVKPTPWALSSKQALKMGVDFKLREQFVNSFFSDLKGVDAQASSLGGGLDLNITVDDSVKGISPGFMKWLKGFDLFSGAPASDPMHRKRSKKNILKGAQEFSGRKAVLMGLGAANDYSLEGLAQLIQEYEEVVVYDINQEAVEKTFVLLLESGLVDKELLKKKVFIKIIDLSGGLALFSHRVEAILFESESVREFFEQLKAFLNTEMQFEPVELDEAQSASYVVSSLVMTQLASNFNKYVEELILSKFPRTKTAIYLREKEKVRFEVQNLKEKIYSTYLSQLHHMTSENGGIYHSVLLQSHILYREFGKEMIQPFGEPFVAKNYFSLLRKYFREGKSLSDTAWLRIVKTASFLEGQGVPPGSAHEVFATMMTPKTDIQASSLGESPRTLYDYLWRESNLGGNPRALHDFVFLFSQLLVKDASQMEQLKKEMRKTRFRFQTVPIVDFVVYLIMESLKDLFFGQRDNLKEVAKGILDNQQLSSSFWLNQLFWIPLIILGSFLFVFKLIIDIFLFIYYITSYLREYAFDKKLMGFQFRNYVGVFGKKDAFSSLAHELVHWLKYQKVLSSDLPTSSMIDSYLRSFEFKSNEEDVEVDLNSFSSGTLKVLSSETVTEESVRDMWMLEQIQLLLRKEESYSEHYLDAFDDKYGNNKSVSEDDEHDYAYELGNEIGHLLLDLEDELAVFYPTAFMFMPTYLFMRSHAFQNKDMLRIHEEQNRKKLSFIYYFSYLVIQQLHEATSSGELNTKLMSEIEDVLSRETLSDEEKELLLDLAHKWIEKISTPEMKNWIQKIVSSTSIEPLSLKIISSEFPTTTSEASSLGRGSNRRLTPLEYDREVDFLMGKRQYYQALEVAQRGVDHYPQDEQMLRNYARVQGVVFSRKASELIKSKKWAKAYQVIQRALKTSPADSVLLSQKAKVLWVLGELAAALKAIDEAILYRGWDDRNHMLKAQILLSSDEPEAIEEAESAILKARSLKPEVIQNDLVYLSVLVQLKTRQKLEKALQVVEDWLRRRPTYISLLRKKVEIFQALGNISESVSERQTFYRKALDQLENIVRIATREDAREYQLKAIILANLSEFNRALAALRIAEELEPRSEKNAEIKKMVVHRKETSLKSSAESLGKKHSLFEKVRGITPVKIDKKLAWQIHKELQNVFLNTPAFLERKGVGQVHLLSSLKLGSSAKMQLLQQLAVLDHEAFGTSLETVNVQWETTIEKILNFESNDEVLLLTDELGQLLGFLHSDNRKNELALLATSERGPPGKGTFLMDAYVEYALDWVERTSGWLKYFSGNQQARVRWIAVGSSPIFYHKYLARKGIPYISEDNHKKFTAVFGIEVNRERRMQSLAYAAVLEAHLKRVDKVLKNLLPNKTHTLLYEDEGEETEISFNVTNEGEWLFGENGATNKTSTARRSLQQKKIREIIIRALRYDSTALLITKNASGIKEVVLPRFPLNDKGMEVVKANALGDSLRVSQEVLSDIQKKMREDFSSFFKNLQNLPTSRLYIGWMDNDEYMKWQHAFLYASFFLGEEKIKLFWEWEKMPEEFRENEERDREELVLEATYKLTQTHPILDEHDEEDVFTSVRIITERYKAQLRRHLPTATNELHSHLQENLISQWFNSVLAGIYKEQLKNVNDLNEVALLQQFEKYLSEQHSISLNDPATYVASFNEQPSGESGLGSSYLTLIWDWVSFYSSLFLKIIFLLFIVDYFVQKTPQYKRKQQMVSDMLTSKIIKNLQRYSEIHGLQFPFQFLRPLLFLLEGREGSWDKEKDFKGTQEFMELLKPELEKFKTLRSVRLKKENPGLFLRSLVEAIKNSSMLSKLKQTIRSIIKYEDILSEHRELFVRYLDLLQAQNRSGYRDLANSYWVTYPYNEAEEFDFEEGLIKLKKSILDNNHIISFIEEADVEGFLRAQLGNWKIKVPNIDDLEYYQQQVLTMGKVVATMEQEHRDWFQSKVSKLSVDDSSASSLGLSTKQEMLKEVMAEVLQIWRSFPENVLLIEQVLALQEFEGKLIHPTSFSRILFENILLEFKSIITGMQTHNLGDDDFPWLEIMDILTPFIKQLDLFLKKSEQLKSQNEIEDFDFSSLLQVDDFVRRISEKMKLITQIIRTIYGEIQEELGWEQVGEKMMDDEKTRFFLLKHVFEEDDKGSKQRKRIVTPKAITVSVDPSGEKATLANLDTDFKEDVFQIDPFFETHRFDPTSVRVNAFNQVTIRTRPTEREIKGRTYVIELGPNRGEFIIRLKIDVDDKGIYILELVKKIKQRFLKGSNRQQQEEYVVFTTQLKSRETYFQNKLKSYKIVSIQSLLKQGKISESQASTIKGPLLKLVFDNQIQYRDQSTFLRHSVKLNPSTDKEGDGSQASSLGKQQLRAASEKSLKPMERKQFLIEEVDRVYLGLIDSKTPYFTFKHYEGRGWFVSFKIPGQQSFKAVMEPTEKINIGRRAGIGLTVSDASVSKEHLWIRLDHSQKFVEIGNYHPTNGTHLILTKKYVDLLEGASELFTLAFHPDLQRQKREINLFHILTQSGDILYWTKIFSHYPLVFARTLEEANRLLSDAGSNIYFSPKSMPVQEESENHLNRLAKALALKLGALSEVRQTDLEVYFEKGVGNKTLHPDHPIMRIQEAIDEVFSHMNGRLKNLLKDKNNKAFLDKRTLHYIKNKGASLGKIELVRGDITKIQVDAIVNAAKPSLLGGGGVDGAIHKAAGPELLEECRGLGGCNNGEAKITKGYNLPVKHVIHTPGPDLRTLPKNPRRTLRNSYLNSLRLAEAHGLESIAFPAISTGVYRYSLNYGTKIAVDTAHEFLKTAKSLKKVVFVTFAQKDYETYQLYLMKKGLFPQKQHWKSIPEMNDSLKVQGMTGRLTFAKKEPVVTLRVPVWGVRHGQTDRNVAYHENLPFLGRPIKEFQGNVDEPDNQLNEKGQLQAKLAAEALYAQLEELVLDGKQVVVMTSELGRSKETADAFIQHFQERTGTNLEVVEEPLLNEMSFGTADQKSVANFDSQELELEYMYRYAANARIQFPRGESFLKVLDRAKKLMEKINDTYQDNEKVVVLFGHGTHLSAVRVVLGDRNLLDESGQIDWRTNMLDNGSGFHFNRIDAQSLGSQAELLFAEKLAREGRSLESVKKIVRLADWVVAKRDLPWLSEVISIKNAYAGLPKVLPGSISLNTDNVFSRLVEEASSVKAASLGVSFPEMSQKLDRNEPGDVKEVFKYLKENLDFEKASKAAPSAMSVLTGVESFKYKSGFFLSEREVEKIFNSVSVQPGDRLLEIGPGHTVFSLISAMMGAQVTVVEPSTVYAPQLNALYQQVKDKIQESGGSFTLIQKSVFEVSSQILVDESYDHVWAVDLMSTENYLSMVRRDFLIGHTERGLSTIDEMKDLSNLIARVKRPFGGSVFISILQTTTPKPPINNWVIQALKQRGVEIEASHLVPTALYSGDKMAEIKKIMPMMQSSSDHGVVYRLKEQHGTISEMLFRGIEKRLPEDVRPYLSLEDVQTWLNASVFQNAVGQYVMKLFSKGLDPSSVSSSAIVINEETSELAIENLYKLKTKAIYSEVISLIPEFAKNLFSEGLVKQWLKQDKVQLDKTLFDFIQSNIKQVGPGQVSEFAISLNSVKGVIVKAQSLGQKELEPIAWILSEAMLNEVAQEELVSIFKGRRGSKIIVLQQETEELKGLKQVLALEGVEVIAKQHFLVSEVKEELKEISNGISFQSLTDRQNLPKIKKSYERVRWNSELVEQSGIRTSDLLELMTSIALVQDERTRKQLYHSLGLKNQNGLWQMTQEFIQNLYVYHQAQQALKVAA